MKIKQEAMMMFRFVEFSGSFSVRHQYAASMLCLCLVSMWYRYRMFVTISRRIVAEYWRKNDVLRLTDHCFSGTVLLVQISDSSAIRRFYGDGFDR